MVFFVARGEVDTLHKIEYIFERAVLCPLINDIDNSSLPPHTLYGSKAKAYIALFVYGKFKERLIYVGGAEDIYVHSFTFVHKLGDLRNIVQVVGEYRSHIFGSVVGF